jgi:hypothetical protein
MINTVDQSQRKAARIVGVAFPLSFLTVVWVNFGIFGRLIAPGDPTETVRNIVAHETLFRIGIAGNLLYCVGVLILLTALYVILRPVDQYLALLAAVGRLVHAFTWLLVSVNLFTALRLLGDSGYSRALGSDQLAALARLYLTGTDAYYVGLLFWALGATLGAYLWFKSNFVPRALAVFGVIASGWCAACTLVFYVFPSFANVVNLWWFDSPMALFELALSFFLLFRGLGDPSSSHGGVGKSP